MARVNLETQLLRSFITIHDVGGFARAADMLNMTQPAISQQMRRLEETLDKPLFQRQGRMMRLTTYGEALLGYARRMIELNDQIAERLCAEEAHEIIYLGVPAHFHEDLLPRIIAETARQLPSVQLVVKIGTSQTLMSSIDRGEIDLALLLSETGASSSVLGTMPVLWMASDECHLKKGEEVPLVLFSGQCTFRQLIIRSLDQAGLRWRCTYEGDDLLSLRAAVRANLGVTGLPSLARNSLSFFSKAPWLPSLPMSEVSLRFRPTWQSRAAESLGKIISDMLHRIGEVQTMPDQIEPAMGVGNSTNTPSA
mgnify:CR=1 FL=1